MHKKLPLLCLLLIIVTRSYATTWDEPWADDVIKEASSFILAKVKACDPEKGITLQIIKTISGQKLSDSIIVNDFYLLRLCSISSGEGPEFHVPIVDSCYFFIKQNKDGKYCIATPTTGFDYVTEGKVAATFRHSYHQALAPVPIYEKAMTAVFNNYHNLPYDKGYITSFIMDNIDKKPAGFSEGEIDLFFRQHVALECIHHLKILIDENKIFPFLNDRQNFHNQISVARALAACNTVTCRKELLKTISDASARPFVQVMCIWTLASLDSKDIKPQLQKLNELPLDKEDSFGGNIMDPRVCTNIPTVKDALTKLIGTL